MYAIVSGKLRLNTVVSSGESGPRLLVFAGALRPILGALFAGIVYFLIQGELIG